jgi:uncharacterized membrane protein YphA (DoxX/SURF4 family)
MATVAQSSTYPGTPSKVLKVSLWIAQGLLAVLFGMAGVMKAFMPVPDLVANGINYAADLPIGLLRFIGIAELSGAIGVILPALTRVKPQLTWVAAAGLATIQVLAMCFHASRGEFLHVLPMNLMLLIPALFVVWGRSLKAPILPK